MTKAAREPGRPLHLVCMGVSGTGKSSVGEELWTRLGWAFAEGDDFHPRANIAKMEAGQPLTDEDRWPWLEELAAWTAQHDALGEPTILTCSALRRSYRDLLRGGGEGTWFVHLVGDHELLMERMDHREGHFMPASLLQSQLDTLEPLEEDEQGGVFDVAEPPDVIADQVLDRLGLEA